MMEVLQRVLATVGVVLLVVASIMLLATVAWRGSLVYLALSAIVVLPVAAVFGLRDVMAVICLGAAAVLAVSPVDFTIRQSGHISLRLLPVSHGLTCRPDTECYGCIVSGYDAKFAIVLGF